MQNKMENQHMRLISFTLIAALLTTAPSLSAQSTTGIFDISKEACSHEFSDGRLEVTPTAIQFWESSCDLTNPTNLRGLPDAKLYDAVCYGEGEEWTYRVMLATDYRGDLIRYTQEGAWTSVRCQ